MINSKVQMAMDGLNSLNTTDSLRMKKGNDDIVNKQYKVPSRSDVVKNLEQEIAKNKADIRELNRIAKIVAGNKIQFDFNKKLNTVIISVIDEETEKVIRQIPSEDMQKLKLRIRQATGSLFDELV